MAILLIYLHKIEIKVKDESLDKVELYVNEEKVKVYENDEIFGSSISDILLLSQGTHTLLAKAFAKGGNFNKDPITTPRQRFYEGGSYDTPGEPFDVYVSGNYAYVADGEAGLRIIKIPQFIAESKLKAPKYPPSLTFSVFFDDSTGDRDFLLDGDENGRIVLFIRNSGKGVARDLEIKITPKQQITGLNIPSSTKRGRLYNYVKLGKSDVFIYYTGQRCHSLFTYFFLKASQGLSFRKCSLFCTKIIWTQTNSHI
ncbi:MAG: hypothetical protein QXN68_04320 [Thermoplasmata archaeon]